MLADCDQVGRNREIGKWVQAAQGSDLGTKRLILLLSWGSPVIQEVQGAFPAGAVVLEGAVVPHLLRHIEEHLESVRPTWNL